MSKKKETEAYSHSPSITELTTPDKAKENKQFVLANRQQTEKKINKSHKYRKV